jgi:SAM-dependent methyltransferase
MKELANNSAKATSGHLIYRAAGYDFIIWLMTLGREGRLRAAMLDPATLATGESVLDLGCGTGSVAIRAKHRVGPGGRVAAVDASLPMLEPLPGVEYKPIAARQVPLWRHPLRASRAASLPLRAAHP